MKRNYFFLTILSTLLLSSPALSCTDFRLTATDGTVLVTRSMEFMNDLHSNLRTSTRKRIFTTTTPNGKPGMSWKAKYGYIYLDGLDQDYAVDGMNEEGLSFEALYLPGETKYQTIPLDRDQQSIPYINFGDWALSNFRTVDEVKQALPSVYFYAVKTPALPNVFPLHFSIQDASGKGIVVEFVNGNMNIYDNAIGVLTNSPTYNWQLTNLSNYLTLSPYNPKPVVDDGLTFAATGQGAGAIGLPGDSSPPSRFVKMTYFTKVGIPTADPSSLLNMAQHIINTVDIPAGSIRARQTNGQDTFETTQWVVFKDLTHKTLYYRTYNDLNLRAIYMDGINFVENAKRLKMPITKTTAIPDETPEFTST